jgi:hypothetical protein
VLLLDVLQHLEAVHLGQPHVEQHQVDVRPRQHLQPGLAGRRGHDLIVAAENRRQGIAHTLVVVDDEECFQLCGHVVRVPGKLAYCKTLACQTRAGILGCFGQSRLSGHLHALRVQPAGDGKGAIVGERV